MVRDKYENHAHTHTQKNTYTQITAEQKLTQCIDTLRNLNQVKI